MIERKNKMYFCNSGDSWGQWGPYMRIFVTHAHVCLKNPKVPSPLSPLSPGFFEGRV